jgi:putative methylase
MNMKKRDLEIRLQSLDGFDEPDPSLEQYPTPSVIASDILFHAYSEGDISGRTVNDLGCGTGIFAIGACLLGGDAAGFDISSEAIGKAKCNAESLGVNAAFEVCDISEVTRRADTTVMNPPFGSQRRNADRPFLDKATELSGSVYSIHMETTLPFLRRYVRETGKEICYHKTYKYQIPHTFSFHSKREHVVDVVMVVIK